MGVVRLPAKPKLRLRRPLPSLQHSTAQHSVCISQCIELGISMTVFTTLPAMLRYRKIFIVMSRYTYINNLQRLE